MSICSDIRDLGIASYHSVLVHSSYKALGVVNGGIVGLLECLRQAVRDGTLMMPAFSYAVVNAENPVFDVRVTPSCVGAVPEVFRTLPDVRRSLCPTHSAAAWGAEADFFTCDHQLDMTPVGPHSPLAKLRDREGKILFLGCGLAPNSSMHGVEELVNPPYLFLPEPVVYRCLDAQGRACEISCKRHSFQAGEGQYYRQRYDRITEILDPRYIRRGRVGSAVCFVLDAAPMWEAAEKALRRDSFFFVERTCLAEGE